MNCDPGGIAVLGARAGGTVALAPGTGCCSIILGGGSSLPISRSDSTSFQTRVERLKQKSRDASRIFRGDDTRHCGMQYGEEFRFSTLEPSRIEYRKSLQDV